ncbi:MAG: nucleotide pyrophosphohydrolase [candidate division WOR-3 bacterium]|nr:MAG: nucleotide pyrophosphohydrolase [candidate division WOR-3 bacterium]
MDLNKYQEIIRKLYFDKDSRRGLDKTFNWLVEEIGELSRAMRKRDPQKIREEFADCLAWLLSVATILGIDAEDAMTKYRNGCPKCHQAPCVCHEKRTCDS